MIKKAIFLIFLIILLTGCQPTPEAPAVVGKQTYSSYKEMDVFKPISVPKHISEKDTEYKNLHLTINAEIIVPDATSYSITQVLKKNFSIDQILSLIKNLTGKDQLYSEYLLTRDYWMREIAITKNNIKIENTELNYAGTNYLDNLQDYLKHAEDMIQDAPLEAQKEQMAISDISQNMFNEFFIIKDNGEIARLSFGRNSNSFIFMRSMDENVMPQSAVAPGYDDELWHKPGEPEIDEETARRTAQECLKQMGGDLTYLSSEPCAVSTAKGTLTTGWQVMFTREISGLQKLSSSNFYINPEALPSYGAPWEEEVFTAVIDKDGVCQLSYMGASKLDKTVIKSTELEDFESINERAVEQLNFIYATHVNEKGKGLDIKITKFELGTDMLSVEDRDDIGQYIPTWRVTFESKWQDSDEIPNNNIIFFNAVDGSYIEPRITNTELMEIMKN